MKNIISLAVIILISSWSFAQNITHEIKMPYNKEFDSIVKVKNIQPNEEIKVYTQYQVDDNEQIVNIKTKGTDPIFEKEARLILQKYLNETEGTENEKEPNKKYTSVVIMKISD